jgi:RNA polymerase sigma-70 factor (ECF subfamily)
MIQTDDLVILTMFRIPESREKAFALIIRKYQEKLYWHVRRMVVEHEDANDVLQNVFIKVWRSLDKFREDSQLYTWLYKIATNESLTFLDQKKKRQAISIDGHRVDLTDLIMADKDFDVNKAEWKLQLAIQQLPEKQRIVFNLRFSNVCWKG